MKHRTIIAALSFMLIFCSCSSSQEATVDERSVGKIENLILKLVNQYRETKDLKPLKMMDEILVEAEKHSQNMANKKVAVGHGGFDQRYQRIQKNIARVGGGGENVAYGNITAKEIVKGWINSPHHRENMEGWFNITGVGVARDKNGVLFYTQIFINQTKK